jgi:hypothetical protein
MFRTGKRIHVLKMYTRRGVKMYNIFISLLDIAVFWDVMSSILVECYRCFEKRYNLQFQRKLLLFYPENSAVSIALAYRLEGPGSIPISVHFYLLHSVQSDSKAHPIYFSMATWITFPAVKEAKAWSTLLTFNLPSWRIRGATHPLSHTYSWRNA